jgi:hypothetical protein
VSPGVTSVTPANGTTFVPINGNATATFDENVQPNTISMVLRDASNIQVAAGVTYDVATRSVTLDPNADLAKGATYTVTLSGAKDASGNVMAPVSWSFTTAAPIIGATIWDNSATPAVSAYDDTRAVEVGVKFRASIDGFITGIRFYKGAGNTGSHVGHLWDAAGNLLATVTFASESATGWQQATFATPVAVTAGQTYVASYYAPVGRYSVSAGYFSASGTTTGPLTALASGVAGGNGVFIYGAGGGFPTSTYKGTNYWVDVLFSSELT